MQDRVVLVMKLYFGWFKVCCLFRIEGDFLPRNVDFVWPFCHPELQISEEHDSPFETLTVLQGRRGQLRN